MSKKPTPLGRLLPRSARTRAGGPPPAPLPPKGQCPICKGAGYTRSNVPFGHPDFGKGQRCKCKTQIIEQERNARVFTWLTPWLGDREDQVRELEQMTFRSFRARVNGPSVTAAAQKALDYAQQFRGRGSATGMDNLILIGTSFGVGKTHLAVAILNEAREAGISALFVSGNDLFTALYASHFNETIIQDMASTGILCLDDADKMKMRPPVMQDEEMLFDYQRSTLFDMFNSREIAKKPTIITGNRKEGWESWLHGAIVSRLTGRGEIIEVVGEDYRQRARGNR